MADTVLVSVPRFYYEGAVARKVDGGEVVDRFAKKVRIRLVASSYDALLTDARKVGAGKDGMAASARAAVASLDGIPASHKPKESKAAEAPKKKPRKVRGKYDDRLRTWEWWKRERHQGNYTCSSCGRFRFTAGPSYERMICRECHLPEEDHTPKSVEKKAPTKIKRKKKG